MKTLCNSLIQTLAKATARQRERLVHLLAPALIIACLQAALFALPALATTPPTIDPSYRVFSSGPQTVSITADAGDSIYYTTDGTDPTTGSTQFTSSFSVSSTTTVKAVAYDGSNLSTITTSIVQIDPLTRDVPTDAILWLKADNGAIQSSGSITTWKDVSGTGNDATQSNSSYQPTLNSSVINSLPAISFDGSTQYLSLPSGFSDFSSGMSLFIVANPATSTNRVFVDFLPGSGYDGRICLWKINDTTLKLELRNSTGTASYLSTSPSVAIDKFQLIEVVDSSTTATVLSNSVQDGQSTSMYAIPTMTRGTNAIGNNGYYSNHFEGDIAEILLFNRSLSSSEQAAVEKYFNSRYSLASYPPSISPDQGVFSSSQSLTITADPWCSLRYTLDGSDPSISSNETDGTLTVSSSSSVRAIQVQPFGTGSAASAEIEIDETTSAIPSTGLQLWLRAGFLQQQSEAKLSQWGDASGNGNDAVQSTSADQPTIDGDALNGLPAAVFDGSSQFLSIGSGLADFTSGASIFIVSEPTTPINTGATFLDFGNSGSDDLALTEPSDTGAELFAYSGTSSSSLTASSSVTTGQFQLLEAIHDGSSAEGSILTDGVKDTFGPLNALSNISRADNFIGQWNDGTGLFHGKIAEILVFDRNLSDLERAGVEGYLCNRFHLTVPPPVIDPGTGVYDQEASVTVTAPPNATIFTTTDGSTPTTSQLPYSGAFTLDTSTVVRAMSVLPWGTSPVSSAFIDLDGDSDAVVRDGLVLWLKAGFGTELNSGNVKQWVDLSGNENDATQSTSADQPALVSSAINGAAAVEFDGSTTFLQIPSLYSDFSAGASGFVVTKPSTLTSGATIFDFGNGSTSDNLSLDESDSSGTLRLHVFNGSTDSSVDGSSSMTAGEFKIDEFIHDGSGSATLFANGSQTGTGSINNISTLVRADNFIGQQNGSVNLFPGQIAELILFNRPLTTTEQVNVESYLLHKFQALSITPDAPVISVATATLSEPTQVTISSAPDTDVFFTLDGSTPTTSSTVYSQPIDILFTQTLKAIAVKNGISSSVSSATYTLNSSDWPAPDAGDPTTLKIQLQQPTTSAPQ